jgi:hypothetical protein
LWKPGGKGCGLSASAGVATASVKAKIPDSKSDVVRVMTGLLRGQGGEARASDHWSSGRAEGLRIDRTDTEM